MSLTCKRGSFASGLVVLDGTAIFPMNIAMATLGLKKMGKFLWEGWEKEEKVGKSRKKGRARTKK